MWRVTSGLQSEFPGTPFRDFHTHSQTAERNTRVVISAVIMSVTWQVIKLLKTEEWRERLRWPRRLRRRRAGRRGTLVTESGKRIEQPSSSSTVALWST